MKGFAARTRFETETKGNSEITYCLASPYDNQQFMWH